MNITQLEKTHPDAAAEWRALLEHELQGMFDDDEFNYEGDSVEKRIANSYFTVDPNDGAILGDGLDAGTRHVWYPDVSTSWTSVENIDD